MSKSVFISRNLSDDDSLIHRLTKSGLDVRAQTLIETKSIEFDRNIPRTDWIFFSSKNTVQFFFEGKIELTTQKLAAVGLGTASYLEQFGTIDFIGQHIDTHKTALEFKKIVGSESVLFPQAKHGLRTIQAVFDSKNSVEIICYETKETPFPIGHPDVLLFSSPSNVESFFKSNTLLAHQRIIVFGHSTGEALQQHGIVEFVIPRSLNENDLFEAIISTVES